MSLPLIRRNNPVIRSRSGTIKNALPQSTTPYQCIANGFKQSGTSTSLREPSLSHNNDPSKTLPKANSPRNKSGNGTASGIKNHPSFFKKTSSNASILTAPLEQKNHDNYFSAAISGKMHPPFFYKPKATSKCEKIFQKNLNDF